MQTSPEQLIDDIGGLITLPDVYLRINRLIQDPHSSSQDIAEVINQDASFTVKILKVANSAFYGFRAEIKTVARAVTAIGTLQVRHLALSLSVANTFKGMPNELLSMRNFWTHSLLCALAARNVSRETGIGDPEALFTAGLLHDIGELIMFYRLPDESKQALLAVLDSQEELTVSEAEQNAVGFDHAAVGAALAKHWNLPPELCQCIAHHHAPEQATDNPREVAVVHIANSLAQLAEIDSLDLEDVPEIHPQAWASIGRDQSIVESTVRGAQESFAEIEQLFIGS